MIKISQNSFRSMLTKGTAVFVCTVFLATSVYLPQAKAEVSPVPMAGYRSLADDLAAAIALPKEIGKIQEIYRGTSDKIVVLIQDAHSIPDAQRSIRSAIDHFQTQYGISTVGLEGASEKLDPQIFRSFPDKAKLREVMQAYASRGELTGGTAAAIFSAQTDSDAGRLPPSAILHPVFKGIEDWPLYEEGISYYLQATAKETEIKAVLDPMVAALNKEKETVYSKELLEVDRLLAGFGENKTDLVQVLNQLSKYQPPTKGSELEVLLEEIKTDHGPQTTGTSEVGRSQSSEVERVNTPTTPGERKIHTPGVNESLQIEVKNIAEQVRKALQEKSEKRNSNHETMSKDKNPKNQNKNVSNIGNSDLDIVSDFELRDSNFKKEEIRQELLEFNGKLQEFRTARTTPQAFALYLKGLVQKLKIRVKVSAKLARLVENQKRLKDIEGTRLFEEFKRYADEVMKKLTGDSLLGTRDSIRRLMVRTKEMDLLKRLARLELSFEDWTQFKRDSPLGTRDSTDGQGGKDKRQATSDKRPETAMWSMDPRLRTLLQNHLAFYRVAEQRDEVFYKNLMKLMGLGTRSSGLEKTIGQYEVRVTSPESRATSTAVLVAGGFHTQGLTQTFKEKGISYVLVSPRIGSIPEEPLYREHMQGQVSWSKYFEVKDGKVNLYDAFVRATRDRLLTISSPVRKQWRDQIIRDLAAEGRITEAGDYTRFIDEISKPDGDKLLQTLRKQWLSNIDRFGEGLKKLQSSGNLTESSILQLIKTITAAPAGPSAALEARCEIRANLLSLPAGSPSFGKQEARVRSEARRNQKNGANIKTTYLDAIKRKLENLGLTLSHSLIHSLESVANLRLNPAFVLTTDDYPAMKAYLERFVRCLKDADPRWLLIVRDGVTVELHKSFVNNTHAGSASLEYRYISFPLKSDVVYEQPLADQGQAELTPSEFNAPEGTAISREVWARFHEIAHLADPSHQKPVLALFKKGGIFAFIASGVYQKILKENQDMRAECISRGLLPKPQLPSSDDFEIDVNRTGIYQDLEKLQLVLKEIRENKYLRALVLKGKKDITCDDMKGQAITPYATSSSHELWAESLTAYLLIPRVLKERDHAMYALFTHVLQSERPTKLRAESRAGILGKAKDVLRKYLPSWLYARMFQQADAGQPVATEAPNLDEIMKALREPLGKPPDLSSATPWKGSAWDEDIRTARLGQIPYLEEGGMPKEMARLQRWSVAAQVARSIGQEGNQYAVEQIFDAFVEKDRTHAARLIRDFFMETKIFILPEQYSDGTMDGALVLKANDGDIKSAEVGGVEVLLFTPADRTVVGKASQDLRQFHGVHVAGTGIAIVPGETAVEDAQQVALFLQGQTEQVPFFSRVEPIYNALKAKDGTVVARLDQAQAELVKKEFPTAAEQTYDFILGTKTRVSSIHEIAHAVNDVKGRREENKEKNREEMSAVLQEVMNSGAPYLSLAHKMNSIMFAPDDYARDVAKAVDAVYENLSGAEINTPSIGSSFDDLSSRANVLAERLSFIAGKDREQIIAAASRAFEKEFGYPPTPIDLSAFAVRKEGRVRTKQALGQEGLSKWRALLASSEALSGKSVRMPRDSSLIPEMVGEAKRLGLWDVNIYEAPSEGSNEMVSLNLRYSDDVLVFLDRSSVSQVLGREDSIQLHERLRPTFLQNVFVVDRPMVVVLRKSPQEKPYISIDASGMLDIPNAMAIATSTYVHEMPYKTLVGVRAQAKTLSNGDIVLWLTPMPTTALAENTRNRIYDRFAGIPETPTVAKPKEGRSEQRVVDETSAVIARELTAAVNPVDPKPVAVESLQLIALKINSGEVDPETLKHTMTKVMAESLGIYKDHLVAKGVSAEDAEAMVEKFRVYHGKLLAFLSNLPKNGTISVGLMIDPKSSHSFLTRFVAALKQVQGVSVEVIAPASVLNDPLLRTKDISGVLKVHPVRGFSRTTVAAGQNEVPLAVDPTSEGQRGVLAEMFRAFRLDFTAIPDQNTLLRDAIEETLATMILVSPDIMEEDGYKNAQSLALKAAYLKGRLNEIFKKDMFGEPGGDGSLTLIGTKVQEYIASLETQKAA